MGFANVLRGIGSGQEYPPDTIMNLCPVDQRPVEIVLDIGRLQRERPGMSWYHPERRNMWRFGGLLALDWDDPTDRPCIVSLGEGHTPLLDYSDHPVAAKVGFQLEIKEEGRAVRGWGANPTQSFKDRGMAMVVAMARRLGIRKLAVPTQGNAGDSLAEYGVAAGLEVAIIMPEDTPMPILGKVAAYAKLYPNVQLEVVRGTIREAGVFMKEKFLPQGYFSVATFQEPGWRIEGKKTLGLELAEPRQGQMSWTLPDVVVYPTGGGTGILGMWKAFAELQELGLIDSRRPRFVAVQSDQTAPVARAFQAGSAEVPPVAAGQTIATGLNVPGGVGHFRVVQILRESAGAAVTTSDAEILQATRLAYRTKGWWLAPEGAACLAVLPQLVDSKIILPIDRVVVFNTSSAEKYMPALREAFAD